MAAEGCDFETAAKSLFEGVERAQSEAAAFIKQAFEAQGYTVKRRDTGANVFSLDAWEITRDND